MPRLVRIYVQMCSHAKGERRRRWSYMCGNGVCLEKRVCGKTLTKTGVGCEHPPLGKGPWSARPCGGVARNGKCSIICCQFLTAPINLPGRVGLEEPEQSYHFPFHVSMAHEQLEADGTERNRGKMRYQDQGSIQSEISFQLAGVRCRSFPRPFLTDVGLRVTQWPGLGLENRLKVHIFYHLIFLYFFFFYMNLIQVLRSCTFE